MSLPVNKVGQTCSPAHRAIGTVRFVSTPVPSSFPSLLTGNQSELCTLLSGPVLITKSHRQGFDPISVTPRMGAGCAMTFSGILMVLRMWMKELQLFPKSSHWETLQGPCWPPQGWSSPGHWAEEPQCLAMLLWRKGRAGPAVIPALFAAGCLAPSPAPAEQGFRLWVFSPCQQSHVFFPFWLILVASGIGIPCSLCLLSEG